MGFLLGVGLFFPSQGFSSSVVICNSNSNKNSVNDLLGFVEPSSEYISSARGFFEHFKYNRLIQNSLIQKSYEQCLSIVKIGARDFGNGNYYGDYLVQVAYSKPGDLKPQYVLSGLYKSGSVQSFEGTLLNKPWYMLNAMGASKTLADLAMSLKFEVIPNDVANPETFNPTESVKKAKLLDEWGTTYDGQGVTYSPLYDLNEKIFLVTWSEQSLQTKIYRGAFVKIDNKNISVAKIPDLTGQLYVGLDLNREASDPREGQGVDLEDEILSRIVLGLSQMQND